MVTGCRFPACASVPAARFIIARSASSTSYGQSSPDRPTTTPQRGSYFKKMAREAAVVEDHAGMVDFARLRDRCLFADDANCPVAFRHIYQCPQPAGRQ